jgi:UDP:flavonoid glycosyltransferase YjiC (YdhE family)
VISPPVAFFCVPHGGHFIQTQALIRAAVRDGMDVVVFTDVALAGVVGATGARFADLFADRSVADDTSVPHPCRYVTFAGRFGDEVVAQARALGVRLVVSDSMAVIGRVVATALGVPHVNVCAGHNVHPDRFLTQLAGDPRVAVSEHCLQAVDRLRDHFGLVAPSPFSYVAPPSPVLNVCCEPPQYLGDEDRRAWEPLVFFGCLPSPADLAGVGAPTTAAFASGADEKLYVSFGTIVWRYFAAEAIACLRAITAAVAERPGMSALVSLGGADVQQSVIEELKGPNVRVENFVDQWQVLAQADAFITHHGLNSTHEAVFHTVPMLSYPFFWDQPALARKSQDFGLAQPLVKTPRAEVTVGAVHAALHELHSERDRLGTALRRARGWETEVIAGRTAAIHQIRALI